MSIWNEKAEDYASANHTLEHQRLAYNMQRWDMFTRGARWQREQLLSEETVERAARAQYEHVAEGTRHAWETATEHEREFYRTNYRAALAAALGEEE